MNELLEQLKLSFLSDALTGIHERGEMEEFIEFAREEAKKDGMDTDGLMKFFDFLEEIENETEEDGINWFKLIDIVKKVTGCKVMGFKGDSSIMVENQEMDDDDLRDYLLGESKSKINLEHINNALGIIDVKLEFIEAINVPFDVDGFQNFCRFKVVKLD